MLSTSARRAASQSQSAFKAATNSYKARKQWPPDFAKLSPKHQFRLERKYKRRAQLKWARPKLMVATKVAQWVAIGSVLVYGVLFMQWDEKDEAFVEVGNVAVRNSIMILTLASDSQLVSPSGRRILDEAAALPPGREQDLKNWTGSINSIIRSGARGT